jgi:glycerol uptake facilitator protein
MSPFTAELLGTALLILLGDGVVANVVLKQTKGHAGGLISITTGWAFAVAMSVYAFGDFSGGHFNPAVTIAMASLGKLPWASVPTYIAAQMLGAIIGATLVWLAYLPHWSVTEAKIEKLAVFCTAPAIRHTVGNLLSEIIGTAVLVLGALAISKHFNDDKGWANGAGPMLVGVVVWSIGLSLGGPTGYAINPARDLGPRIAHAILPLHGKGSNDWGYAWIPVVGPIIGGLIAALIFKSFWA